MQIATFIPADVGFELLNVMIGAGVRNRWSLPGTDPAEPRTGPAGTRPAHPAPSCPAALAQVSMNVAFYRIDSVERHNH
jgi:hypothetical protein